VFTARFARDGETIVYSAAVEGSVPRLYVIRSDYPEPRPVGDSATQLLSISSRDELAVLVRAKFIQHRLFTGTLARMPMGGGAPREILADVRDADWAPSGTDLAIIHRAAGKDRLEYPIGKVLYQSAGYLSDVRFSRAGDRIAFFEHPLQWDDRGGVAVVDLNGKHRTLTDGYWGLEGLAWSHDGKSVIYGGALEGGFYQIHSVTLGGEAHLILPSAGTETIQDVSAAGHWLLTRDDAFQRLMVKAPGAQAERDLSWLDNSSRPTVSRDGQLVAFEDEAADAGANYAVMIRQTVGSPATRLGEGGVLDLSADKQWVLSAVPSTPPKLMLYPTGPGQARQLDHGEFESYTEGRFLPDGKRLIICGNEPARAARCYLRSIEGGPLRSITPEGTTKGWVSPDGLAMLSQTADGGYSIYSLEASAPRAVPALTANDVVARWSPDGKALWLGHTNEVPVRLERLDLATGRRTPLASSIRAARSGLLNIQYFSVADDGQTYAYLGSEYVSHIFEVRGMR
jgi:Tol biopolymer transport system component